MKNKPQSRKSQAAMQPAQKPKAPLALRAGRRAPPSKPAKAKGY